MESKTDINHTEIDHFIRRTKKKAILWILGLVLMIGINLSLAIINWNWFSFIHLTAVGICIFAIGSWIITLNKTNKLKKIYGR